MTDELSDANLEEILERRFTYTIVSSCVDVPRLVAALRSERTQRRAISTLTDVERAFIEDWFDGSRENKRANGGNTAWLDALEAKILDGGAELERERTQNAAMRALLGRVTELWSEDSDRRPSRSQSLVDSEIRALLGHDDSASPEVAQAARGSSK